jgi:diguanylate cyclase (GGDEF)-like protein/PAS domain S-box-containing protein
MKRSSARLGRAIALVIVVALLVLAGIAWSTHEQSVRLDDTAGWADRTRATVSAIEAVSLAALDAESAQRAYLLGSTHGLPRYRDAVASARANLSTLEHELGDDPKQAALLAGLRTAVDTHFARLDKAVALTPAQPEQARAIVIDGAGSQTRRDIQTFATAMTTVEGHRFDERVAIGRDLRRSAELFGGGALVLLALAMAGGTLFVLRELKLRAAIHAELVDSRTRLELGERRLRAIADNMPACIAYVDKTGTYRFANAAFKTLFGDEPEHFIGRKTVDVMGPVNSKAVAPHVEAALAGQAVHFEKAGMGLHPDHAFMVSYVPDIDAQGGVDGYYVMSMDITERKRQEEALRKSEGFLERTGKMARVGGWEVDLVGGVVVWSHETRRIHGVDADYVPDLATAIQFYAPESRPQIEAAVNQAIAEGTPWDLELPIIRADGRRLWVRAVGTPEFADGVVVRLVGACQDIDDRVAQRLALKEANDRIALATESGGIGIWELDIATGELIWDPRMYALFEDTSGGRASPTSLWAERVHPEDLPGLSQAIREATQGDRLLNRDYRVVLPDGRIRHLRGTARAMRDADGTPQRLFGANWDITELRELAASLAEDRTLLSVTLASIGDAVITTNAGGHITWLNPVAERLTGWTSAEATGRPLAEVFHIVDEHTREPAPDPVARCLAEGHAGEPSMHALLLSRGGQEFGIEDSVAPIRSGGGQVLGVVLVFHDVSEQRRLSGEMSWRATHDALTGLVNRTEFEARLGRLLESTQRDGSEHALMYIDLDQFKLVNDACGHAVGDQLLQQMARMLADTLRARDTLARLGGDEFAIVMERCSADQALRVAQKICEQMDDFRFVHEGRRFRIGTSIGLVAIDRRWQSAAAIQQAADTSCYAAKEAGRNRVHTWFDTDVAMRERQYEMQWTTRIEHALDEDGFVLFAQRIKPLNHVVSGLHAEVLLRLHQPDGVLVAPGAFLPAAERFHLASRIDRWVLRNTIEWLAALPDPQCIELLSVNLSGQSVGDRSFHCWALELLAKAGSRLCSSLCLEISETAAVANVADATLFVDQVRAVGVRVALDDFGGGAASFGYLKTLRVDTLKIDGQFVRDLVDDPLDEVAVRCFTDVAKVMGLTTVAEFVDKPAILARLQEMGIDFAQGYLLHEPAPIDQLIEPVSVPA